MLWYAEIERALVLFAGDVDAVGRDVTTVRPGDRVSIMPLEYCGTCYFCRRGMNNVCPTMKCVGLMTPWGGLASAAVLRDYQVTALPDSVSYEQGALIEPAAAAAYGVARAGVAPGDAVLIGRAALAETIGRHRQHELFAGTQLGIALGRQGGFLDAFLGTQLGAPRGVRVRPAKNALVPAKNANAGAQKWVTHRVKKIPGVCPPAGRPEYTRT